MGGNKSDSIFIHRRAADHGLGRSRAADQLRIRGRAWVHVQRGIHKKCVPGQAVYPLSEQDGLKAQERRYTAYGKEKH